MSKTSRLVNRWMKLPPAHTQDIVVTRDIQIPMPDGVILFADHFASRNVIRQPTILIRSPYGRSGLIGSQSARSYAERGFQVLVQSCRGTAGSGGEFRFARNEHDDGLATIEWIKRQGWFSGELAMVGASYLGFVQWAIAADAGPELKAIVPQITTADFNHFRYQGGSFTLETSLGWATMMAKYASSGLGMNMLLGMWGRNRKLEKAYRHLPIGEADRIIVGQPTPLYQNVLSHGPDDDYWKPVNFSERVGEVTIPIYLMGGWYDLFLAWLCVVEPSGKSINLCDGIIRLTPDCVVPQADGSLHVQIAIWPTAYYFRRGQRIRIQVSSGAHPRFVRNPGTGEPLATATKLRVAEQTVFHDPEHPSSVLLPVIRT